MTPADRQSSRVLILAPIGRDGPATAEILKRVDLQAAICPDLAGLCREVLAGAAAVFVAEEALFGKDISALADWVERQPPWSELPFIVLTSHHVHPSVVVWRQQLVGVLRNVSLIERPMQGITLTSTVQAAVRARSRQYEVCELIEARERTAQQLEALVVERTGELERANQELRGEIAERARIEESLRQAQKMEAVGRLTGGIAHDFNNLLMVISGGLDMLEQQQDPARRRRLQEGMRHAAQRGAGLTRQLLAFSRRQPLQPESVDLNQRIGAMRELLDGSLRGDIQVRLEFAEGLWPVHVDPGELELVVLNLAVNARDAMPSGGVISIRAENAPDCREGDVQGDFVLLSIADTGTGMSAEVQAHIFEPFFTTKDIGKGSGLGLAQVYGFASQSGGAVRVDSEPGAGTRVTLLLPRSRLAPSAAGASAEPGRAAAEQPGSHGCVLLVEDDDNVAALVSDMLEDLGYEVVHASSASAALGALANGRAIDVVFSDVMMPGGMDGVELAREIRSRRRDLPVLLTSGRAERAKASAEALGFTLLPKPYRLADLAKALNGNVRARRARAPADRDPSAESSPPA